MVAQASRMPVPEEFSVESQAPARGGFRVAVYGPLEAAPVRPQERGWLPRVAPAVA
jgi:hypothetical protein